MKSVCIVVLNYNGISHLEYLIPSLEVALKFYQGECSLLILDNSRTKDDEIWLNANYPHIKVISAPKNDYLFSYNWLLPQLSEEIIILLNNDLKVSENFIEPLVRHFNYDDVFAVSATSLDWEGKHFTCGPSLLSRQYTLYRWGYDCDRQELSHTLFTSGGFSAVDRAKFIEIGGFNDLFYPAYCEDLDLGFRAWRKGWRCIFEPNSKVYHRSQGSWGKEKYRYVEQINLRAELLFVWSSLPPIGFFLQRFLMMLWIFYLNTSSGKWWCIVVWYRTWIEWLSKTNQYKWMKITNEELQCLERKLLTSVSNPNKDAL